MAEQPVNTGHSPGADTPNYDVNFFKPKTPHSKANMTMIITMVLVWAIAVFGFQFMLIIFNEPTPEKGMASFESVWASMQSGDASTEQKQEFARVCLSVLGKNIAVKDEHKEVLKDALTQTVLGMVSAEKRAIVTGSDKKKAAAAAAAAIELSPEGFDPLRYDLLPYSLLSSPSEKLSDELPAIMELYLVHNQSFLTDFRFLGFPFHYWYTAQFLLILFVVLCLIYAYQTDRSNEKYNLPDD